MKKLFKSMIALLCAFLLVVPVLCAGCGESEKDNDKIELIDYVSSLTLDMTSNTKKQEVEVKLYIDGDTTHFDPINPTAEDRDQFDKTQGYIKARYIAIDTPESTGAIEEWGKKASNFTHDKLASARKIIVESDTDKWDIDSTGERYVLWVWYLPDRYGEKANLALMQAQRAKLYVFSGEKDPDFYYGSAIPLSLKQLRCYASEYNTKKVVVTGTVVAQFNNSVYIEEYDVETGMYFGMPVFYGYTSGKLLEILSYGNRVKVVGTLSAFQGSYQISGVAPYDPFDPDHEDNCQIIEKDKSPAYVETEAKEIVSGNLDIRFIKEVPDSEPVVDTVKIEYGEAVTSTTVMVKDLKVTKAYTTNNGGKNDGAISLTCQAPDGTVITVRTEVLKENGVIVTQDRYVGKTITVKGLIERYVPNADKPDNYQYQIKCYQVEQIIIH